MFLVTFTETPQEENDEAEFVVIGIFDKDHLEEALDQLYRDRGWPASYRSSLDREVDGKNYKLPGSLDVVDIKMNDYRAFGHQ